VTTLVLTVVGDDRAGLVAAVADIVAAHGANWENSRLAELAGSFAGVIEISVPGEREEGLRADLERLEGTLTVSVHTGQRTDAVAGETRRIELTVLGNDRAGIVRDISSALGAHGVSIENLVTETRDAAMYGGRLFEASVEAEAPASVDLAAVRADLERIATEIQVDITFP
jgi:glycine cleavage system regulatory protein